MSATVRDTKILSKLDLSIRTVKPRSAANASQTAETQDARVVIVTCW